MQIVGTRIRKLRVKNNVTQLKLSKELNVSESAISNYEKGTRTIHIENLIKIANFFEVDMDFLVGRDERIYSDKQELKVPEEVIKFIEELQKMNCYKNIVANPIEFARIIEYETKDYDVEVEDVFI